MPIAIPCQTPMKISSRIMSLETPRFAFANPYMQKHRQVIASINMLFVRWLFPINRPSNRMGQSKTATANQWRTALEFCCCRIERKMTAVTKVAMATMPANCSRLSASTMMEPFCKMSLQFTCEPLRRLDAGWSSNSVTELLLNFVYGNL